MNDDPSSIADAVKISRKTMTIVREYNFCPWSKSSCAYIRCIGTCRNVACGFRRRWRSRNSYPQRPKKQQDKIRLCVDLQMPIKTALACRGEQCSPASPQQRKNKKADAGKSSAFFLSLTISLICTIILVL